MRPIPSPMTTWTTCCGPWIRSLRARNLAPKTVRGYTESASQMIEHLRAAGVTIASEIERAHIEDYLAGVAARWRPATVSVRYRALQQLFGWLLDEEEIERHPMTRMKSPTVPENPVPVLTLDELRRLVASCDGRSFADRRDNVIIRLFAGTGRFDRLTPSASEGGTT
jgi:integrase/recombinase XerC